MAEDVAPKLHPGAELDTLMYGVAGVERGGGDVRVDRELQQFALDMRAVGGDVPLETPVSAACPDLAGPGALRRQRHEAGRRRGGLRQIGKVGHILAARQISKD